MDITRFGWEVKGGIPSPCVDSDLPAPQGLIDVINCGCMSAVTATTITYHALSTVHAQQPMGVATHTQ